MDEINNSRDSGNEIPKQPPPVIPPPGNNAGGQQPDREQPERNQQRNTITGQADIGGVPSSIQAIRDDLGIKPQAEVPPTSSAATVTPAYVADHPTYTDSNGQPMYQDENVQPTYTDQQDGVSVVPHTMAAAAVIRASQENLRDRDFQPSVMPSYLSTSSENLAQQVPEYVRNSRGSLHGKTQSLTNLAPTNSATRSSRENLAPLSIYQPPTEIPQPDENVNLSRSYQNLAYVGSQEYIAQRRPSQQNLAYRLSQENLAKRKSQENLAYRISQQNIAMRASQQNLAAQIHAASRENVHNLQASRENVNVIPPVVAQPQGYENNGFTDVDKDESHDSLPPPPPPHHVNQAYMPHEDLRQQAKPSSSVSAADLVCIVTLLMK